MSKLFEQIYKRSLKEWDNEPETFICGQCGKNMNGGEICGTDDFNDPLCRDCVNPSGKSTNQDSKAFKDGRAEGMDCCEQGCSEEDVREFIDEYDPESEDWEYPEEYEEFIDGIWDGYYERQSWGDGE